MKPFAVPIRQVAVQEITRAPRGLCLERAESEAKLTPFRIVHEAEEALCFSFAAALFGERAHEG